MEMIGAEQVHALLDWPGLIEALRRGHLAPVDQTEALLLREPRAGGTNDLLVLPAWRHGGAIGVKLVTVFPENPARGPMPAIQALVVLFDGATGAPRAVIDGTALTYRKTAADSALGSAFLSRPASRRLVMVGAGGLAEYVIGAHLAARPGIAEVAIWNRDGAKARALAGRLDLPGVATGAVEDLEAAVRRADIVSCATSATEPLVRGAWLAPGCHLDLIGSYTPAMAEADQEAVTRARIWGDSHRRLREDAGEIVQALAAGAIAEGDILGDLHDLAAGRCPVRESADEITLFKNAGGGHLDLMVAEHLVARAGEGEAEP